jgi:hypothetical protein
VAQDSEGLSVWVPRRDPPIDYLKAQFPTNTLGLEQALKIGDDAASPRWGVLVVRVGSCAHELKQLTSGRT